MTEELPKPRKTVLEHITGTTGQVTAVMIALTAFLTQVPELKTAVVKAYCSVLACAAETDATRRSETTPAAGSTAHGAPSEGATGAPTAEARLAALGAAGIDFSVSPAQIREWLGNPLTPYPALADALVALLAGRRLRQPVYLDVIAGTYENRAGSPRTVAEVNRDVLKAAVVSAYGERYGAPATDFQALLQ